MKANAGTLRHIPQSPAELAPFIDHTLLKANATLDMIENLCREALTYGFYAVCVNGAHVAAASRILKGVNSALGSPVQIAAVVGFPLGAMTSEAKAFEAVQAVANGATEIDMVMRIDFAKSARWEELRDDISTVVRSVESKAIVKVILETGLLSLEEIAASARWADLGGAHFVKTCTGFSTAGGSAGSATVGHVALMRESVRSLVQVKASGGIRDLHGACALIEAGATRLGTSSGVLLVSNSPQETAPSGY